MTPFLHETSSWAIVLANGDGSLLDATLDRTSALVPAQRTLVVVERNHLTWAKPQVARHRGLTLLVQPINRGTGTALVLALTWLRTRRRDAHVLVLPSEHFVRHRSTVLAAMLLAERASRATGITTLVGERPECADPEYGWIVPDGHVPLAPASVRWVRRFVEKTGVDTAERLRAAGALRNTSMFAAPAAELWHLSATHVPRHVAALSAARTELEWEVAFAALPTSVFDHDVLACAGQLAVAPMDHAAGTAGAFGTVGSTADARHS